MGSIMSNNNVAATVDAFAQIEAEFKVMKKRYEAQKENIVLLGEGVHMGEYYTVEYSRSKPQSLFDKDGAMERAAKLGLTPEQIEHIFGAKKLGAGRDIIKTSATAPSALAA